MQLTGCNHHVWKTHHTNHGTQQQTTCPNPHHNKAHLMPDKLPFSPSISIIIPVMALSPSCHIHHGCRLLQAIT
jgi:hypothetical protein